MKNTMLKIGRTVSQSKRCLTIIGLLLLSAKMMAQIPNYGFEDWTTIGSYENPTGWATMNSSCAGPFYSCTKSTDHYPVSVGNFSIRVENNTSLTQLTGSYGMAITNAFDYPFKPAFPIIGNPNSLCGYYKYNSLNNDSMFIRIVLFKSGTMLGYNTFITGITASTWTSFTLPITYTSADSATIWLSAFYPNGPTDGPKGNSVLYVDNLSFDNLITSVPLYVKYNATGSNNGTSWTDAYTSFQSALTAASSGDQIWVAKGTYKPSSAYDLTNTSRYYHFRMKPGVAIYGGFAGTETAVSQRTNYGVGQANETILSGDLNDNGKDDNDCYHVFYHPDGLGLTSSAILDGFTIKGGNANGDYPYYDGGGMYNYNNSSPSLTNCTFSSNSSGNHGGGMFNVSSSSPTLTNCIFTSNSAIYGGGMSNISYSSPSLTNCIFTSNSAAYWGGGMWNFSSSSPTLTNCTFSSNSASQLGGGMFNYVSSPTLNNCIIWGNEATNNGDEFYIYDVGTTTLNFSCYANESGDVCNDGGTFTAINNNITSDPQFAGSSNPSHPYSILGISPCADAGLDSYNSQAYDIRGAGYPRKLNKTTGGVGTIDMGAYEYKVGTDLLPVELTSFTAIANGATVTLNWQSATEVNNYGFEIERRTISNQQITQSSIDNWQKIGFVKGSGTSNLPKKYSYSDATGSPGRYVYRLKQVDNDGSFKYSQSIEVTTQAPEQFALAQNYPNPFNPSTTFHVALPVAGEVKLVVMNILGQEVAEVVNKHLDAGTYDFSWNAKNLSSGVYFYRLQAGSFTETKKLVLLR